MKKIFFSFAVFSFLTVPFALAEEKVLTGCDICLDNCEEIGVPEGRQFCPIKYVSPHTPSYSSVLCPENSSYTVETQRCECFEGFYAPSPYHSRCIADTPGDTLCEKKYGTGANYATESRACYCRDGFEMKHDLRKGIQCIKITSKKPMEPVPQPQDTKSTWKIQTQVLHQNKRDIVVLKWFLENSTERRKVRGYRIFVTEKKSEEIIFGRSFKKQQETTSFFFTKGVPYTISFVGVDRYGNVAFETKTEFLED